MAQCQSVVQPLTEPMLTKMFDIAYGITWPQWIDEHPSTPLRCQSDKIIGVIFWHPTLPHCSRHLNGALRDSHGNQWRKMRDTKINIHTGNEYKFVDSLWKEDFHRGTMDFIPGGECISSEDPMALTLHIFTVDLTWKYKHDSLIVVYWYG